MLVENLIAAVELAALRAWLRGRNCAPQLDIAKSTFA
jgi:hypothetical protein